MALSNWTGSVTVVGPSVMFHPAKESGSSDFGAETGAAAFAGSCEESDFGGGFRVSVVCAAESMAEPASTVEQIDYGNTAHELRGLQTSLLTLRLQAFPVERFSLASVFLDTADPGKVPNGVVIRSSRRA